MSFSSKDTMMRMKRQVIHWEKIFADHIADKELVFRIYIKSPQNVIIIIIIIIINLFNK